MPADDAHLPAPVVQVLAPQAAERGPRPVATDDGGVADDAAASVEDPIAELVILIADHRLVEAETTVRLCAADPHEDGVHVGLPIEVSEGGSADPERCRLGQGDRGPDQPLAHGLDGAPDHVGARSIQGVDSRPDVIRAELGVSAQDPDHLAGGRIDPEIPGHGLDPTGIIPEVPAHAPGDLLRDDLSCPVVRVTIEEPDL